MAGMVGYTKNAVESPGTGKDSQSQNVHQRMAGQALGQPSLFGQPGGTEQGQQVAAPQQGQQAQIKVHGDDDAILQSLPTGSAKPRSGKGPASACCGTAIAPPGRAEAAGPRAGAADGSDTCSVLGLTQTQCAGNGLDVPVGDGPAEQFIPAGVGQLCRRLLPQAVKGTPQQCRNL